MKKSEIYFTVKEILSVVLICVLGFTALIFCVLYLETFDVGLFFKYYDLAKSFFVALISILTTLTLTHLRKSEKLLYKLTFLSVLTIFALSILLFVLKRSGFLSKVSSIESLREYVGSFGALAEILFVTLQFLQVIILPIPSILTVTVGALVFGAIKGAILSSVGIIFGSLCGFFVGRLFGVKVVSWIVGREALDKGLRFIKGKDKLIFSLAFLLPFFPDDVLCFVAGVTTIKVREFVLIVMITRSIAVLFASLSVSNMLIPYDAWWGLVIWIAIFIALFFVVKLICSKNGNR